MQYQERKCGTCSRWQISLRGKGPGQHPCKLDGKERLKDEMNDCLGWKEQK